MTPATILAHIAGPLCGIGVAVLFAAIALLTWRMPEQGV